MVMWLPAGSYLYLEVIANHEIHERHEMVFAFFVHAFVYLLYFVAHKEVSPEALQAPQSLGILRSAIRVILIPVHAGERPVLHGHVPAHMAQKRQKAR